MPMLAGSHIWLVYLSSSSHPSVYLWAGVPASESLKRVAKNSLQSYEENTVMGIINIVEKKLYNASGRSTILDWAFAGEAYEDLIQNNYYRRIVYQQNEKNERSWVFENVKRGLSCEKFWFVFPLPYPSNFILKSVKTD